MNHFAYARLLAFALLFAACSSPTPTAVPATIAPTRSPAPAPTSAAAPLTKSQDGLNVALTLAPLPLKVGVPEQIGLVLVDDQNRPVSDATVKLSLGMSGMNMGTNEPPVKDLGNGAYAATAIFSMGGNTWFVDVNISRNGKTTRISFSNLDVRE
jgi:hypothetical protein